MFQDIWFTRIFIFTLCAECENFSRNWNFSLFCEKIKHDEKSREKNHWHREPHAGDGIEDEDAGEVEEHVYEGDLVGLLHVVTARRETGQ